MSLSGGAHRRRWFAGILAVAAGLLPGLAQAIDEIFVTAERREASLQETPISITAFSDKLLEELGIEDSEQLAALTPGLVIQRDVIGKVVIRGIGAENFTVAGDPGVAINYDGAYISRSSVAIFDMFDLERVEVLRGPQGTLYGRNATGGAINFISRKPTEALDGFATMEMGDYDKFRVEGAVGGPISDQVLFRVAGMIHERDGFTDNIFPDVGRGLDQLDNKDLWAGRAFLTLKPTDDLDIQFKLDAYRDDSNPPPYKYTDDPVVYFGSRDNNGTPADPTDDFVVPGVPFPNPTAGDLYTVSQGFESDIPGSDRTFGDPGRWDQTGYGATVNWSMPNGMTLRSITAYREMEFDWLNDGDGLEAFLVTYFQNDDSDLFTQEFQLLSANDGPLTWVAGLFYLDESSDSFIGIPINGFANLLIDGTADTTAYAVFGQAAYAFTDGLRGILGLRYNYEEKEVSYVYDRFGTVTTVNGEDDDWNSVTPKIGIEYDISDDSMLYGTVTNGFKSGGFNLLAVQSSYDEETVWSYELGAKNRFLDGRLQLNANVFYMDYDDLQVGKVVNLSATIQNAAKANMYGAEVEVSAEVTDQLRVDAGVSWLETEYDQFETEDPGYQLGDNPVDPSDDPAPPDCGTLIGGSTIDLAGCELPRAPNFSGFLAAAYVVPLGGAGDLTLAGNLQYTDDQYFTQFNRDAVAQDSYSVWNARVTWGSADGAVQVALYGENLGDEEYFTNSLESGVPTAGVDPVVPQYFVGAPRTWGVKVQYNFGAD
jgi:iron complex outermembrane receptor protein